MSSISRHLSIVLGSLLVFPGVSLGQYHPEHPKVVELVNRGVAFLEKSAGGGQYAEGSACLTGYTLLKVTGDPSHPKVAEGIKVAQDVIRNAVAGRPSRDIVYDTSVATVLLASVDPIKFRPQLESARDWFQRIQKPHGGFGYLDKTTGDSSMVQYVMLATWTLSSIGITTPPSTLENTIRYLRATQDPTGAWGYQGVVSPGGLVPQENPTKSLATAGLCGLLLACDQLKFFGSRSKDEDGIPKAFERIDLSVKARGGPKATMKYEEIEDTVKRAFRYQENSPPQAASFHYYWMYGQERYESLREIVDGKQQKSPAWYNQGVEDLAASQRQDGSWFSPLAMTAEVDTALAILFLIRSTQKAIGKLDEGLAFGGYDLPMEVSSIRMVGDKVVSNKDTSVENLLSLMEDDKNRVSEGMLPNNMILSKDPKERTQQVARLSRLLDSNNAVARRLAARLLGRSEDLNVVPDLIYALSDPDPDVPKLAEEGLRLLSRHLATVHVKQNPTEQQRAAAVAYWKEWYKGLRPDYVFIDR